MLPFPMCHAGSAFSCYFSALDYVPDGNLAEHVGPREADLKPKPTLYPEGREERRCRSDRVVFPHQPKYRDGQAGRGVVVLVFLNRSWKNS